MSPAIDPLPYESRTPGTLEAGEVLLWEGAPLRGRQPPSVRKLFVVSSVVLIVLLTGGTLLGMAGLMRPTVLAILLAAAAVGVVVWALRYREEAKVAFRVTDRRLLRIGKAGDAATADVNHLRGFAFNTERGQTSCQLDAGDVDADVVLLERTPDPAALERLVASLPTRANRSAKFRRRPRSAPTDASGTMPIVHRTAFPVATPEVADVALADGEVILWSGRPRPRDPVDADFVLGRVKIIAWMLVPVAVLIVHSGVLGFRLGLWALSGISIVWIVIALYALTLGPWLAVRRRRRTTYYLTNLRAIEVHRARSRTARSIFLDMVNELSLLERDDGFGDLAFPGNTLNFQAVEGVRALHAMTIDAVRNAGGAVIAAADVPTAAGAAGGRA